MLRPSISVNFVKKMVVMPLFAFGRFVAGAIIGERGSPRSGAGPVWPDVVIRPATGEGQRKQ